MNRQSKGHSGRLVVLGAMLLLAATASGCGVGLPTQPDVDASVVSGRGASAAGIQEMGDSFEIGDTGQPGDGSGAAPPPSDEEIVPSSGPGNSDWGHSHKHPK